MQPHPIINHRLADLHRDGLLAAAQRDRRCAAARSATRHAAGIPHAIGAALIRLGARLQGVDPGARAGAPSPAVR